MCHECPDCGQMCYCDGDDTYMDYDDDCLHCLGVVEEDDEQEDEG